MIRRKPTPQDHKSVLKRIRKSAIFNCALLGVGIYCDAQVGSDELVIRYKKKLPDDLILKIRE